MRNLLALGAAAGLATVASARGPAGLSLSFSDDLGASWKHGLVTTPGSVIWAQVVMTVPDSYYGIGGSKYNVVCDNAAGWDRNGDDAIDFTLAKGSATDGRTPGFDFGGQTQQTFESVDSLRIDVKGDTTNNPSAGISTFQNTPDSLGAAFNTQKSVAVYRFRILLSSSADVRTLSFRIADGALNGPTNEISTFKAYESASSTFPTDVPKPILGDTADLVVIPAPSAAIPLGAMGILVSRRRR